MRKSKSIRRLLCMLLTAAMLLSMTVPSVFAAPAEATKEPGAEEEQAPYALTDYVRVSIELDKPATLDAGFSVDGIAANTTARSYRQSLRANQDAVTAKIEAATGEKLDVKWNLTLAADIISANVRYGDIAAIRAIPGVKSVFLETRYEAPAVEESEPAEPNTANTSTYMVGAAEAWAEGYTGAGSRIAIIDTGLDTSHQSVNADAFNYAIQQTGKTVSLFTSSDLTNIKDQLNGSSAAYISAKIPFGYNYVDENTTVTHLNDTQGEHGSHVAGIAAANRFIKSGSSYVDAASTVHAVGMAPDAQLFVMKVFGSGGGAYDSDYMVAIEDAIVLGCDVVNLSLGSAAPGFSYSSSSYQTIMNKLANASSNSKLVVSISAGNAGALTENLTTDLYIQDIAMHTGGNPGSFINSLCVASADNTGITGTPMTFNGNQKVFYNETSNSGGTMTAIAGSYSYVYIDAVGNAADYSAVNSAASLSGKIVIVNRGEISFVDKGNNLKSYSPKGLIVANNADGAINMALDDYTGTFPMVSITLADANTIKANSTAHTTGSYTYYTGTVSVSATLESELITDNPEMSYFSSWGVPGSLLMKPEITAPGGNIYSIFGTNKTSSGTAGGSDKYELMSGTSMAAPHIAGLTGTLAQYLRENNVTLSGKTTRQIAQSLLMSTAVPMHIGAQDGPYYPILQQGAGLVNVHQAIHASSFIFMNSDATISHADGKVKAEIGDLPGKSGTYTYSFNIYNTASKAQTYSLSTDLFTQDRYEDGGYAFMSESTTPLDWNVTYSTGNTVTVAAGGSQTVTVTITVPSDMSAFDALYPCGAYVEGYTYVESQTTSNDGAKLDVRHSIPILGFYGSWTDPSMFDNMSYVDQNVYGETRTAYTGTTNTNYMTYTRSGTTKYVTGNPYFAETPFPADRLALRPTDTIYQVKYSLVRSAGTTAQAASKIDDEGKVQSVLYSSIASTNVTGLYYSSSSGAWQNTAAGTSSFNKTPTALGASSGDRIRVGFYAIPEYNAMQVNTDVTSYSAGYLTKTAFETLLKRNVLGKGAMIGYDFYVDDTAPTVLSAIKSGTTVTVTVQDDNWIAKLALLNGTTTIQELIPEQTAKGEAVTYTFDLSGVSNTSNLQVFVGDYASNETTQAPEELLYSINASSNNTAWGTVSVVGNTILAAPAEGYYVESVQVTSGTASPVINGNTITVNPTSDCAILVVFAAKPVYTVTYKANGADEGSVSAYVNDVITLPSAIANTDIAEDYTFIGWYVENLPETTEKPAFYAPGEAYTVTADATLLALFKRVEGNDGEIYRLITELPDELSGNYVISSGTTAADYIMINTTGDYYRTSSACTTIANGGITIADGVMTDVIPSQVFVFTPSATSGYYRIMMNSIDGTYVADSSYGLTSTTNAEGGLNIWSITPGTNGRFLLASQQYSNYQIGLNTTYNAFDTIRNSSGVYLWKGEPAGISYYTTNPLAETHDHEMLHTAAVAPTCGADGNIEYWRCQLCGKYFTDAAGENQIELADTVIPATGNHTFGACTSNNDGTHNHTCSVCGTVEAEPCTYTDTVVEPTETTQGYTLHTCTECGYSYKDNYVAALGSDFTVHFSVPAGVTKPADMVSNTNTGITLPTVEAPEGYVFKGWVLEDYDNVTDKPATILTGTYIAPEEVTLKALFTYVEGGSGDLAYELVTEAPTDWSGRYLITYLKGTSLYAMKGLSSGTSYEQNSNGGAIAYSSSGMTLDGTTLTGASDLYVFEVEPDGTSYTIKNVSTETYVGIRSSTLYALASTAGATYLDWTITLSSGGVVSAKMTNSNSYPYLAFSSTRFWAGSSTTNIYFWAETVAGTTYWTTIIGEEHVHTPAEPVIENNVDPTCTEAGHYDSVIYCSVCGEEISRETVTVPALGHTPAAAVKENETAATCTTAGGYDMVVYCSVCNEELSREHTEIPATGHAYGAPEWTWNADNTAATAKFTCANCSDVQTLDAVITETELTEAKPHVAGEKKLTATVTFNEIDYTDEKTVEIEALPCPCVDFTDMPEFGTPEHEAIDWAFVNGITAGLSATEFGTNKTLNRAQAATFLYAAADKPEVDSTATLSFNDVVPSNWYYKPVLWAASNNLVVGYEDGTFKPNNTLTRAQILTILYAWAGKPAVDEYTNPYSDVRVSNWYYAPAVWAYNAGIERGENGKFAQGTLCTRATFVLYLYRHMTGNCLLTD